MAGILPWCRDAASDSRPQRPATGLRSRRNRTIKAAWEWLAALSLVLAFSPLLLAITWLVRRDGGPALFIQRREGLLGKSIHVYKFRSMRVTACNPNARNSLDATGARVTQFGHFLRRTGLDELPKLFNVLNGSMSLIGPRPHVFAMQVDNALYSDVVPDYHRRLNARPGITGLAQVHGWCGAVETHQHAAGRVVADCEYIESWTPWLDLTIVAKTILILLRSLTAKPVA